MAILTVNVHCCLCCVAQGLWKITCNFILCFCFSKFGNLAVILFCIKCFMFYQKGSNQKSTKFVLFRGNVSNMYFEWTQCLWIITKCHSWHSSAFPTFHYLLIAGTPLYPYGFSEGDADHPSSDDACSRSYDETITVFGETRSTIYVSVHFMRKI